MTRADNYSKRSPRAMNEAARGRMLDHTGLNDTG
jgi:hypothetical protein